MPPSSKRSTQVFLYLFILLGVVALALGAWNLFRSLRCSGWPTTEGMITSGEIYSRTGGDDGETYGASLTYDYHVAGKVYTGTRLAFGVMESSVAHAQATLDRYPVGKKVTVHYAPKDPGEAVLEPGAHGGTWICFVVGTIFVLFGAGSLKLQSFAGARCKQ